MNPSSSTFRNPSFGVPNSSSSSFGTTSVFGQPSSTTHGGLWSASPNPSFGSAAHSFGFGGGSSAAPSSLFGAPSTPSPFGAPSSPFNKPNPTSSAAPVTFQFAPPVNEEPRWGSPVNTTQFDGITISAEKAAILGNIKLKHPTCLSSLRLRSESHRRSAYEHLAQVIEELKGAMCRKGACNSYEKVLVLLDDLEIYGFDMGWLREEVVKLRDRTLEVNAETEAIRKRREELVKQIAAIDAELAAKDDAPSVAAANATSPEFVSEIFSA